MKIFDFNEISSLRILPESALEWVREAFMMKSDVCLPPKISIKQNGNEFFNTMPCLIPQLNRFGVKEVSRFPSRVPSLQSQILLYEASSGNLLSLMDATWITCMRTGAVAATAVRQFEKSDASVYAFVGLGNTARATMMCLVPLFKKKKSSTKIKLFAYKEQELMFIQRFNDVENVQFEVVYDAKSLVENTDVLISCVTSFDSLFCEDKYYGDGMLLVPVHTRGFQNCDLFFDKIFADDKNHVSNFANFAKFKKFGEISDVLIGKDVGRANDSERIISYNIGIALHDVFFASKIYDMLNNADNDSDFTEPSIPTGKFWM